MLDEPSCRIEQDHPGRSHNRYVSHSLITDELDAFLRMARPN